MQFDTVDIFHMKPCGQWLRVSLCQISWVHNLILPLTYVTLDKLLNHASVSSPVTGDNNSVSLTGLF